jgi:hypothetical protein
VAALDFGDEMKKQAMVKSYRIVNRYTYTNPEHIKDKMTNQSQPSFDQWCILELFGRQVIAGRVTEQVIGGCSFIRIDVPETDHKPAFTRFYGQGAIYAMTPVSEEVARVALRRFEPEPVNVYVPELRQLTGRAGFGAPGEESELGEDDDNDDDPPF